MKLTVQELFHIMVRDYDDSEKYLTHAIQAGTYEGGRSSFYKVLNHNANISVHNALWYANQLGFDLKAVNRKTNQEYTLLRDQNVILKKKRAPQVNPDTQRVILKIHTIQHLFSNYWNEYIWADEQSGVTLLWKKYKTARYNQWGLLVEHNGIFQKALNLSPDMLLKIEPFLSKFIEFVTQNIRQSYGQL